MEQTECLKSWIRQVVKAGGFITIDIAAEVLGIKGLDKVEGNIADNPIKLPEDEWEYN